MCWPSRRDGSLERVLVMHGVWYFCAWCGWLGRSVTVKHLKVLRGLWCSWNCSFWGLCNSGLLCYQPIPYLLSLHSLIAVLFLDFVALLDYISCVLRILLNKIFLFIKKRLEARCGKHFVKKEVKGICFFHSRESVKLTYAIICLLFFMAFEKIITCWAKIPN